MRGSMSKRQNVYERLMEKPVRSDITWGELRNFLIGSGAILKKGNGSGRRFIHQNEILRIHKPHPQKVIKKVYIKGIQDFIIMTDIKP